MNEPQDLKVLIIEDSDDDAVLICEELRRGGYRPDSQRVESASELKRAVSENDYEVIISDYSLPQFTALEALRIVQASGKDIPVIVVSGSVREATIVEVMRAGARDYVMKENLTRLPLAVARELAEAADRHRRRQFEEQLRHTQRLESLGVLAGGVAHDFNNLLTGILGNVSLAMDELPYTSQVRPMLEQAIQAAEQAANLTRQMLAYAGKGKFVVERIDVSAAVRDISALLAASVSKSVHLRFELTGGLPAVEGDRRQFQQILMNLVTNAAEAIGQDRSGTVLVTTGTRDLKERDLRQTVLGNGLRPGEYVTLEVRDTGSGIEPKDLSRIFDPFFTTKFTGRGLGLSAVMGIVRSHQGAIQVRTSPENGTVFTIFLPAMPSVAPGREQALLEDHAGLQGVALVVDDEETIRRTAKTILEKRGLHVIVAETGAAGLESFRRFSGRICLVLLDLTMPGMSGNEVLREIRLMRPEAPVILSSGYNESEAMQRVDAGSVTAFLQKPYTASQLLEKVKEALSQAEEPCSLK